MTEIQGSRFGELMVVSGEVRCSGPLTVAGRLDGMLEGGPLSIVEGGVVSGSIQAAQIRCAGVLQGKVVTDSLQLDRGGCQIGTVETKELHVASGAVLDCALQSGTGPQNTNNTSQGAAPLQPVLDLVPLLDAFDEGVHPCCMDVVWSVRGEIFGQLLELLARQKPLIKVCGESGSGRSELLGRLAGKLSGSYTALCLRDVVGSVADLLQQTAVSLGLKKEQLPDTPGDLLTVISKDLERRKHKGERVVLLIDDAHTMYPATMEGIIRQLTSACDDGDGLLQIVLFGSSTMKEIMVATILEYFEDETNCQLQLDPLTIKDTAEYLRYALQRRGGEESGAALLVFPYETIKAIHLQSGGNLARINKIAAGALRRGHDAGLSEIPPVFIS